MKVSKCAGFRMSAQAKPLLRHGAGVGKPPGKETAGHQSGDDWFCGTLWGFGGVAGWRAAMQSAIGARGDGCAFRRRQNPGSAADDGRSGVGRLSHGVCAA
jgi:hypothetical protein